MKTQIIALAAILAVPFISQAQETYLSSLGLASSGSYSVGSNSWVALGFETGSNNSGYLLNTVQLSLSSASGNSSGFTVMLYKCSPVGAIPYTSSLYTLSGASDPESEGIYTYTSSSSISLQANTLYWIVVTSTTAISDGSYALNYSSTKSYNSSNGWTGGGIIISSTGNYLDSYTRYPAYGLFSLTATAVPEPGTLALISLGGIALFFAHKKCL
jgi:hypothetical protein